MQGTNDAGDVCWTGPCPPAWPNGPVPLPCLWAR
jgi:hypothetical protein